MPKVTTKRTVRAKKKCCKDTPRCKACPVVLKRLAAMGYGERHPKDRRRYVLAGPVPKKTLKVVRAA